MSGLEQGLKLDRGESTETVLAASAVVGLLDPMGLAPSFEATDVVVADHGTRLFLSPAAAERLEERTLQAAINGGGSAFFLDQ